MQDPAWQAAAKLRKKESLGRYGHDPKKKKKSRVATKKTTDTAPVTKAELLSARMPYGKYKGWFITELPVDYLHWASNNMSAGRVNTMCRMALDRRLGSIKK
jgi:uncharacterized protein (DUF3820 family)